MLRVLSLENLTVTRKLALGFGLMLALAGALLTALAYVAVRQLGRSEHPLVIVLYFPLMAVPLTLPAVRRAMKCHWLSTAP